MTPLTLTQRATRLMSNAATDNVRNDDGEESKQHVATANHF